MGQCPACKKWNTFVEEKVSVTGSGIGGASKTAAVREAPKPVEISAISLNDGLIGCLAAVLCRAR